MRDRVCFILLNCCWGESSLSIISWQRSCVLIWNTLQGAGWEAQRAHLPPCLKAVRNSREENSLHDTLLWYFNTGWVAKKQPGGLMIWWVGTHTTCSFSFPVAVRASGWVQWQQIFFDAYCPDASDKWSSQAGYKDSILVSLSAGTDGLESHLSDSKLTCRFSPLAIRILENKGAEKEADTEDAPWSIIGKRRKYGMLPEGKEGMINARDVVSRVGRIVFGECIWQISQVLVKYEMCTLKYLISCVTGQILSAENWHNELKQYFTFGYFFLPSVEASLAVNNSRTSRKLLCYV